VIGTSAGGLQALSKLVSQLHAEFPIPILVVQHISADATGIVVLVALNKSGNLKCRHAKHGGSLLPGHLYLAPSDHHLMIKSEKILLTKGT
jgi:two-component system chemotaxis response regulator CheB